MHLMLHSYSFKLNYLYAERFDVFRLIDIAAAAGFSGLALSAYAPLYRELSGASPAHLSRLRDRFEREGFVIDLDNAGTEFDTFERVFELAGTLGARHVRTFTRPHGGTGERIDKAARDLDRLVPLAERAGIPIVLENHEDLTGLELAHLLRRVNTPWVQAVYDFGNSMVLQEDPWDALEPILPWVRTCHLKDHVVLEPPHNGKHGPSVIGVEIGTGAVPVMELLARLLDAGVDSACFQSVWGYHPALADRRGGAAWGQGVFAPAAPPYRLPRYCLDSKALAATDAPLLCGLEAEVFLNGLAWLKARTDAAGIRLGRPLDPDAARRVLR